MTARSCNVDELSDQDRLVLERILGQSLAGDETIEVRAYHRPESALADSIESIQQHFVGVPATEIDKACEEVRYGHK